MKRESQQPEETSIEFEDEIFQVEDAVDTTGDEDGDGESDEGGEAGGTERQLKVRLDKWLWAARFFKTRALARAAVEAGKVSYNNERSKPSREIEVGAILKIRQGRFEKTVVVKGLSTRRRSTEEAFLLFEEQETLPIPRTPYSPYGHPPATSYGHPFQRTQFRSERSGGERSERFDRSERFERNVANVRNERDFLRVEPRERRGVRFLRRTLVRNTHNNLPPSPPHSRNAGNPYVYQRQTQKNEVEPVE